MKITDKDNFSANYFGPVSSTYSRKQAIDDGLLIDVISMSQEAGFKWPVALTYAAWKDCVPGRMTVMKSRPIRISQVAYGMCCRH